MVLQRVEPFVLDLPTIAIAANDLLHVLFVDRQVSCPHAVIGVLQLVEKLLPAHSFDVLVQIPGVIFGSGAQ